MNTFIVDEHTVRIPDGISSLSEFRNWLYTPDFPETAPISFLQGEVRVDMSKEQFSHNQVKGEIASILTQYVKTNQLGVYFSDGYRLTNLDVELSTNPDGMFASSESLSSGKVRLVEGAIEGFVELEGSPDMVLEVISPSSAEKDSELLPDLYWEAKIREYWLVDTSGNEVGLEIFRHTSRGYVSTRKQAGWLRSNVFGQSFQLVTNQNPLGFPEYSRRKAPC